MRLKKRVEEFDSRFGRIMQDMLMKTRQDDESAIIISTDNLQNLEKYLNNVEKRRFNDMLRLEKLIKSLEERVEKQEETINALIELCKPLIINRVENIFGEITTTLEKELKDLFGGEGKRKKGAKSSAEKCKNVGKVRKPRKKTSKKGGGSSEL